MSFGNNGIVNTDADTLTITEATTAFLAQLLQW